MDNQKTTIDFDHLSSAFGVIISSAAVLYAGASLDNRKEEADLLKDIRDFVVYAINIIDQTGRLGKLCTMKARGIRDAAFDQADEEIDERADALVN